MAHVDPAKVVEVVDPVTNVAYVIMRADIFYEKYRAVVEGPDFDVREAYPLMDAAARAAGLDDS